MPAAQVTGPSGDGRRFTGRTALVTGATGWIGGAISRRLSAEGANIVALGRRRDRLDALVEDLGSTRALAVTADVTARDELEAAVRAAVDRFGGLDVLVSNAGTGHVQRFDELSSAAWQHQMSTNVDSVFLGAQAVLPHLKRSRGSIVNIASISGLGGDRGMAAHNAAKGAVVNLTRSLAVELGEFGVRANAVAPALTVADEIADGEPVSGWLRAMAERQALPGHGTPEDIAAAVAFLASDDARFITGAILPSTAGPLPPADCPSSPEATGPPRTAGDPRPGSLRSGVS